MEDFIREFSQDKQILNVSLNIHSTRSFCENCGLSLLVATYGDGGFAHRVSTLLGPGLTQFNITGSFRYWHEPKEAESPIQADRFNFMNLQEEISQHFGGFGFLARRINFPKCTAPAPAARENGGVSSSSSSSSDMGLGIFDIEAPSNISRDSPPVMEDESDDESDSEGDDS